MFIHFIYSSVYLSIPNSLLPILPPWPLKEIISRAFSNVNCTHRRKNSFSTDANDEISGSGDITNLASVTLSYDRLNRDEIRECLGSENDRKLILAKNRLFGKTDFKGIILEYDEKSKRIYEKGKYCNWSLGWEKDEFHAVTEHDEIPF